MATLRETLVDLYDSLAERPDELMREIGAGGELLLARLRVALTWLLLSLPLSRWLLGGQAREALIGLSGVLAAIALAHLWLALARQRRRHRWLPAVTSGFDVSMVTLVLLLLYREDPAAALNSLVVWSIYPLAIYVSTLRNDARVTLFAGGLAMLQYGAMVAFAFATRDNGGLPFASPHGTVTLADQLERVLVLGIATLISAVVVFRAQRLVALSAIDGLTGLPNRTYLVHRVPQLLDAAQDEGLPLTLALIDLDHFGRVNERFGHDAGDRALRHAAHCLREALAPGEPLIRIGGEEFALLLRLPMGAAWERMEKLRERLEAHPFAPGAGGEPVVLTLSAGLAAFPYDAADLSNLMKRADLRLRAAKRQGQNQVIARDEAA